jgi:type IV secretory pathway VirB10-like protein
MSASMHLSQNQAAKAAGVSRTQIARLIKKGKISVQKSDDGEASIDLSELRRVYPTADPDRPRSSAPRGANTGTPRAPRTPGTEHAAVLQERVAALLRDNDRLAQELERTRIEAAGREQRTAAEIQRLLGLLEDTQRRLPDHRKPEPASQDLPERRGLWARITGRT